MSKSPEDRLYDQYIDNIDPYIVGDMPGSLSAAQPLASDAKVHGIMQSRKKDPRGEDRDGITMFNPNFPLDLNIVLTLANNLPLSQKHTDGSSPVVVHTALDLPDRLRQNTGKYNLRNVGAFILGVIGHYVNDADSDIAVYTREQGAAKKLYTGQANVVGQIMADLRDGFEPSTGFEDEPSTAGLLNLVDVSVDQDLDAAIIVSDFIEGYDAYRQSFEWQEPLQSLQSRMGDRLMVVQLSSPAQDGPVPGTEGRISMRSAQEIQRKYAEHMAALRNAQAVALHGIRAVRIDGYTNNQHPVPTILEFLTDTG